MIVPPLPRLEAVTFHKTFSTGRTTPCVLGCQNADGSPAGEYVVKLAGGVDRGVVGLACECVSSRFAALLGIPAPAPAVIRLSAELVSTVQDPLIRRILDKSVGENFGTAYFGGGYSTWPVSQSITAAQLSTASDIFAFDVLINNPDRRRQKPNLLFRGEDIFVIDHEMAFSFTHALSQPADPAEWCSVEQLAFLKDHLFRSQLHKREVDYSRLVGASQAVDDEALACIEKDMPRAWKTGRFALILPYVKAVLRRRRPFTDIAKEVLAAL